MEPPWSTVSAGVAATVLAAPAELEAAWASAVATHTTHSPMSLACLRKGACKPLILPLSVNNPMTWPGSVQVNKMTWVSRYEAFWNQQLDALTAHLAKSLPGEE
jgi:hypothetical protein